MLISISVKSGASCKLKSELHQVGEQYVQLGPYGQSASLYVICIADFVTPLALKNWEGKVESEAICNCWNDAANR